MRSEANRFLEALQETIDVARATGQRAEAYHLKAAGEKNWPKMAQAVAMVEAAHGEGLEISANMSAYTAGATGLTAALPPWVQAGGQIGSASCRERVCQYVYISGGAVPLQKQ